MLYEQALQVKEGDVLVGSYSGFHYQVLRFEPEQSQRFPEGVFLVTVVGDKARVFVAVEHVEPLATLESKCR